jgi:hypothetical protein
MYHSVKFERYAECRNLTLLAERHHAEYRYSECRLIENGLATSSQTVGSLFRTPWQEKPAWKMI